MITSFSRPDTEYLRCTAFKVLLPWLMTGFFDAIHHFPLLLVEFLKWLFQRHQFQYELSFIRREHEYRCVGEYGLHLFKSFFTRLRPFTGRFLLQQRCEGTLTDEVIISSYEVAVISSKAMQLRNHLWWRPFKYPFHVFII